MKPDRNVRDSDRLTWTCGRCGESFEVEGVVSASDLLLDSMRHNHLEAHRIADMPPGHFQAYMEVQGPLREPSE